MAALDPAVHALLEPVRQHFITLDTTPPKLQCILNGHTLPAREKELRLVFLPLSPTHPGGGPAPLRRRPAG